jgi:hypothetical protein
MVFLLSKLVVGFWLPTNEADLGRLITIPFSVNALVVGSVYMSTVHCSHQALLG